MSRFWQHFWPTHANCHTSVARARPAESANAWRLAWVGQNSSAPPHAPQRGNGRAVAVAVTIVGGDVGGGSGGGGGIAGGGRGHHSLDDTVTGRP